MIILTAVLAAAVIIASGIVSGVFFAVSVSYIPALFAMPMGQYVQTHRMLGKGWHPVMPMLVTFAIIADAVLAIIAPTLLLHVAYAVATVLYLGISYVSNWRNVPINRKIAAVDPAEIPADWPDPRPEWRRWHRVRLVFAFAVMAVNTIAALGVIPLATA